MAAHPEQLGRTEVFAELVRDDFVTVAADATIADVMGEMQRTHAAVAVVVTRGPDGGLDVRGHRRGHGAVP